MKGKARRLLFASVAAPLLSSPTLAQEQNIQLRLDERSDLSVLCCPFQVRLVLRKHRDTKLSKEKPLQEFFNKFKNADPLYERTSTFIPKLRTWDFFIIEF